MIGRRSLLLGLSATLACTRERKAIELSPSTSSSALPPPPAKSGEVTSADLADAAPSLRGEVKVDTWTLGADGRAITIVPKWTDAKLPLLFAFHGRGEANKGPALGVQGWTKDYMLVRALSRVCAPPLTTDDFEGFVEAKRLADTNARLEKSPFAGLVIVTPYSPDVDLRKPAQIQAYSDYVMNVVVPRAKKELPVIGTPAATGIDGVSLGGALSLRIGLGNAAAFGAVGTLQPAIGEDQIPEFTELAKAARAKNPKVKLRLLTSKDDYFKKAVKGASEAWHNAGVDHELEDLPGPHDYPFNRGPGAIEMLLWHDRVLGRGT